MTAPLTAPRTIVAPSNRTPRHPYPAPSVPRVIRTRPRRPPRYESPPTTARDGPHRMHHVHTCQRDHALAHARWWMCTVGSGMSAADFDDEVLDDDSGDTLTIDPDEQQRGHNNDRRQ